MGPGWYYWSACQDKFTVRVGSIFERSHIALHKWLLAFRLMASSKKGVSAHQIHRTLGITYKSAWFLMHRIREAMKDDGAPLGGEGKTLEIDETFQGYVEGGPTWILHPEHGWQRQKAWGDKRKVITLVERGGKARSVKVETGTARGSARSFLTTRTPRATSEPIRLICIARSVGASPATKPLTTALRNGSAAMRTPIPLKDT